MRNNTSMTVIDLYNQYLFGKVTVTISEGSLYIECNQTKDDITYESSITFDTSKEKLILTNISFTIHNYRFDTDILIMESNISTYYIHDTLMTILDVVLNRGLKRDGGVQYKYK